MRTLLLLPTDSLGGAETVLKSLARELSSRPGAEVEIVFLSKGDRGNWSDLRGAARLHFIDAKREMTGVLPAMMLIRRLSRRPFDLALASHTHCNGFLGALRTCGMLRTHRLIVRESTLIGERFHGLKRQLLKSIYVLWYRTVDVAVCQTPRMEAALRRFIPKLRARKVVVLPNPVNVASIRSRALEAPATALPTSPYIVAIGRLVPVKGFDILLRAFARLAAAHPDLSLVIIGEGEERANLTRQAEELGIAARLAMPGHLKNPFPIARQARAGVLASRIEGFPNVVLEMLSIGLPVVSTRCADGLELLPNVTLCEPESIDALAEALERICTESPALPALEVESWLERRSPARFLQDLLAAGRCEELEHPAMGKVETQ